MALYGNIAIRREWCESCESWAFVRDGLLQCCDQPVADQGAKFQAKRVVRPTRFQIQSPKRKRIIESQGGRCFYCNVMFGKIAYNIKRNKYRVLTATIDHVIPVLWGGTNAEENLVGACCVCNGLKRQFVVSADRRVIRSFVLQEWERKGYVHPDS